MYNIFSILKIALDNIMFSILVKFFFLPYRRENYNRWNRVRILTYSAVLKIVKSDKIDVYLFLN